MRSCGGAPQETGRKSSIHHCALIVHRRSRRILDTFRYNMAAISLGAPLCPLTCSPGGGSNGAIMAAVPGQDRTLATLPAPGLATSLKLFLLRVAPVVLAIAVEPWAAAADAIGL